MTTKGNILLVRHGQDTDNLAGILNGRRDTKLTELGRQQAKAVADQLKAHDVTVVLSSPLLRARETANIISSELNILEIIIIDDLVERAFGIFTGIPVSEITDRTDVIFKTTRVNYFLDVEGAESFPDLYVRASTALREINDRFSGKTVVAVTHGDIGAMIRAAHNRWSWEEGLSAPYFANTGVIALTALPDDVHS